MCGPITAIYTGLTNTLCGQPRRWRCSQLQTGAGAGADSYNGTLDCFRKIIKNEGVSRLYRGISAPILMEAPKRATKFAANDEWGKVYRSLFGQEKMNQSLSVLTGASAGATESFVVVPLYDRLIPPFSYLDVSKRGTDDSNRPSLAS